MKKKKQKITTSQKAKAFTNKALHTASGAAENALKKGLALSRAVLSAVNRFICCKYSAAPLSVLILALMLLTYSFSRYNYLFGNFPLHANLMTQFYLIDYSVGFVSRALVGHIISLFTNKISFVFILRLTRVVVWLSLILQAVIAAIAIKKAWLSKSPLLCVLFLFFAISPHTVIPNVINFGVLDTYNLLLAILYIYISDTRAAYIMAPVICFTGIILHYEFALAYLTAILSIELYHICAGKTGRKLRTAVFFLTAAGSAALTVYLVFFSKYHTKMDASELYDYMCSKYDAYDLRVWGVFKEYFTYYIYGDFQGIDYSSPAKFVSFLINYAIERINPTSHLFYALSTFPVFGLLGYLWVYICKRKEKGRRLPYLVFLLQPLTLAAAMVVSTDTSRWAGATWFSCFMLLFTVLKSGDPLLPEAAAKLTETKWKKALVSLILLSGYACAVYIYASY